MASVYYNANPQLKSAGVQIEYTQDNVLEYAKCKADPIYFIKNYVKIISLDHGLIPFTLYDYQSRFIESMHNNRRCIGMFPRQHGKCLQLNTKVKKKKKSTNKIVEVTLGEFYEWQRFVKYGTAEDIIKMQQMQNNKPQ